MQRPIYSYWSTQTSTVLTWLQIIVNNGWLSPVQIVKTLNNLLYDRPSFPFWQSFVLFEMKVQIVSVTIFYDSAK